MSKLIDWSKPIQTRGGRKAVYLSERDDLDYPIAVAVFHGPSQSWDVENYARNGSFDIEDSEPYSEDIINAPEEVRVRRRVAFRPGQHEFNGVYEDGLVVTDNDGAFCDFIFVDGKLVRVEVVR